MKKLNKLFAILVAMAMVLSLTVISAFAAQDSNAQVSTNETDVNASVKKTLVVPEGTNVADLTYSLSFVNKAAPDGVTAPTLSQTFDTFENAQDTDNAANTKTFVIQHDNFLPAGTQWPAAGYYEYEVTEVLPNDATEANGYVGTSTDGKYEIKTDYSAAKYTLKVGIATDANGAKYIASVSVTQNLKDDGTAAEGNKVPITANNCGFNFNNSIVSKKITGADGSEALEISKTVVDKDNASMTTDQLFTFTLDMTAPAGATGAEIYNYKIVGANGQDKTGEGSTGSVTTGTQASFQLGAGEKLVFTNMSVGASYVVNEASYPQYTTQDNMGTTAVYIDDNGNSKAFTNKYDSTKDPETGLSIANLPFIVLALVAIGGLVAYVVVRRKSEDNA